MQIVTNGRNIELTEAIKDHVTQKMGRLESHYDFILEIHVILEVEKNPRISQNQLAEATVHVSGAVIRVEVASESLYTSIDQLVDKIERSLRKYKTKLANRSGKSRHGHQSIRKEGQDDLAAYDDTLDDDDADQDIEIQFVDDATAEAVTTGERN